MISEESFADKVIKSFKNITKEIEKGSSEHDVRYRFVKYFVEEVLNYEPKYIKWEKKRADLTIIDENDFAVIKIETKKPTVNINKPEHEEQAFKYEEEATRYIGLTNFLQFKLWEIKRKESTLKINIDFSSIVEQKKSLEDLSSDEQSQILFLNNLTKQVLFDPSKYEKFDETYARIDITHDAGFKKLLDRLNYIGNTLLYGYTLKSFGEYKEGYGKYQEELRKAEMETKSNGKNHDLNHSLAKYKQKLDEKYAKYKTFSGYELWKEYSGKEGSPDDEVKEIFCKETIYVFLNKLLFLRICEDKGLLEKNISNGGIEELRGFLKKRFKQDIINKEILEIAFKSARGLYSHFYETGILDWFRTGDGELNELLNRILWNFNQFDFTHIDRDILGNLYEKYLPGKERKRLGEFYTPTEVIDYILTSVGYTYSKSIETKDILDPACGSGGFLVRASRRLISRYLMKFGKTDKKELRDPKNWKEIVGRLSPDEAKIILEAIQEHIYGLDINPFACHIAEMNILFQTIDLFQKVRENDSEFKLERFKIYRTDSLESVIQRHLYDFTYAAFLEEQEEIDTIKQKKFEFVVGNPPYVRQEEIGIEYKKMKLKNEYSSVYDGRADLYVYFIKKGLDWLGKKGHLGFITSNKFMNAKYGDKVREYLTNNILMNVIIDFGDVRVFKDARNYTCILIFSKSKNLDNKIKVMKVTNEVIELDNPLNHIYVKFNEKSYKDKYLEIFEVIQQNLGKGKWTLSPSSISELKSKIESSSKYKLKDCCENFAGMRTGSNDSFIVDSDIIKRHRLEKTIIKKCLRGKDAKKFRILFRDKYVIYTNGLELNEYPNIESYLMNFKLKLSDRAQFKQRTDIKWYEIEQPVSREIFDSIKIITPSISDRNNFTIDEGEYYCLDSCYIIKIKDKFVDDLPYSYLLGILNSKLLEFYIQTISPFVRGKWYTYKKQYTDALPIIVPSSDKEKQIAHIIVKNVNEIIKLNKSTLIDLEELLNEEVTEKLCNLPKIQFSIKDNTKFDKIISKDNKIFINQDDFIEIKNKQTLEYVKIYLQQDIDNLSKSDNVKSLVINIPVPKSPGILNEIINKGDVDQSKIDKQVEKLEDENNKLVYELYSLKSDEIDIIEKNP